MKRLIDIAISALVLILSSPFVVLLTAVFLAREGLPLFYRGIRVGYRGSHFRITKFRTMAVDGQDPDPHGHVAANDPRITGIGRAMRRLRLDEWPQWWHVLRGDMSIVGPRPMTPQEVESWPAHQAALILAVRPGLVDWATLAFLDEGEILASKEDPQEHYRTVIRPRKLALARHYATQPAYRQDPAILLQALQFFVFRLTGRPFRPSLPHTSS